MYGVAKSTYENRIEKGWNVDDALTLPSDYLHNDKIERLAKRGIPMHVYYRRKRVGWNELEATGQIPRIKKETNVKRRMITANGKTQSLDAWSTELGVSKGVISTRLSIGWSELEALGIVRRERDIRLEQQRIEKTAHKNRNKHTHNGVTGSLRALAKQFDIPYHRLVSRVRGGWHKDRWFEPGREIPRQPKVKAITPSPLIEQDINSLFDSHPLSIPPNP